MEEGAGASDSPKVAAAMVAGVGRSGQVAAAAIQIARGERERERCASEGLGWVGGLTQTRAGWLNQAGWAG
jgi:hypothetical protein